MKLWWGAPRDLTLVGFHRHELDSVVTIAFRCVPVQLVEVFLRNGVAGFQQSRLIAIFLVQRVFNLGITTALDMHEFDGFGGVLPPKCRQRDLCSA